METPNKFHSLDIHIFQQGNKYRAIVSACKIFTKILCYNISAGKQIMITLFLACFTVQVIAAYRSSEKKLPKCFREFKKKC